jgi:isoleucyl-tRNA synthetase
VERRQTQQDVLKMGIDKYNEACRAIVMRYAGEWERIVGRLGRWVDFRNDYKTMNVQYMESVWWVFKKLHDKDLVYRGFKVRTETDRTARCVCVCVCVW